MSLTTATEEHAMTQAPPCSCGHERVAHEHYRAGTDCALCECARFARSRPRLPVAIAPALLRVTQLVRRP